MLKEGKIEKGLCVLCGSHELIMHHENYNNPYCVIWLCDNHHTEYRDGKIDLFRSGMKHKIQSKKYSELKRNFKSTKAMS